LKVSTEVERLIKAPADMPGTVLICNECVALCVEVLAEHANKQAAR
jgi:ClpX C4-type zinc finger protein